MRYTIFSIDNSRAHYTAPLDAYLDATMRWERSVVECVNGRDAEQLEKARQRHGYDIKWHNDSGPRVGHLGIWYTVLNAMVYAPVVTFEDDALLGPNFSLNWGMRFRQLPKDTDFFSLFLPRDHDHVYNDDMSVSTRLTRTYQRYGGVSMYYTKAGVEKIKALLERDGLRDQYDNTLYAYAKAGELNGYCSKPRLPDLVYISGTESSIVQESEPWNAF